MVERHSQVYLYNYKSSAWTANQKAEPVRKMSLHLTGRLSSAGSNAVFGHHKNTLALLGGHQIHIYSMAGTILNTRSSLVIFSPTQTISFRQLSQSSAETISTKRFLCLLWQRRLLELNYDHHKTNQLLSRPSSTPCTSTSRGSTW